MQPAERAPAFARNVRFTYLLVAVAVVTAFQIARGTGYNVHPDEFVHVDAFCYFETHWWPPALDSDELAYSPYGWSRVYDGEIVYLIYGRLGGLVQSIIPGSAAGAGCQARAPGIAWIYRSFNVILYLITLAVLFWTGRKHAWALLVGLLLVAVPQVTYVYAYANSDAWGLSMGIFLFVFVLARGEKLLGSWPDVAALAGLTGLVLLSKETGWLSLPFSYLLLGWFLYEALKERHPFPARRIAGGLALLLALVFAIVTPSVILYPLTQGDFEARAERMREARAGPGLKPSQPTTPGYRLAERGFSFKRILADGRWIKLSMQSLYARFGYMSIKPRLWVYHSALALFLSLVFLTYAFALARWRRISLLEKLALLAAPLAVLAALLASMFHSWTFDYQPQGRYLFSTLVPLALIFGGAVESEPRWLRRLRLLIWALLYVLGLYVLWVVLLGDPQLVFISPPPG
jgi:hypothetical protein